MVLTFFLLADYALQQFSGVFSHSTQKLVMPGLFPYWCKSSTVAGKQQGIPLWQGAGMRCTCGKQRGQACGRCSGGTRPQPSKGGMGRMCQQRGGHLQRKEGRCLALLEVTDEPRLRGAGLGSKAVRTDSFQVRLEPRSHRVRGIICSWEDVKRVIRDSRQRGAGVALLSWTVYKIHPYVSTCFLQQWNKAEIGLGTLRKLMHLVFGLPPVPEGENQTFRAPTRLVLEERLWQTRVLRVEKQLSHHFRFCQGMRHRAGGQVKERSPERNPTTSSARQKMSQWESEGSRGRCFSSPHPQPFRSRASCPKGQPAQDTCQEHPGESQSRSARGQGHFRAPGLSGREPKHSSRARVQPRRWIRGL